MIDRRVLLALGMSVVVMPASLARAGQRPKIGFVSAVQRNAEHFAAFEAGLRESGLEPDRQLEILERYADGDLATVRRQIDELAGLGIAPTAMEVIVPSYLWRFRKTGQFKTGRFA